MYTRLFTYNYRYISSFPIHILCFHWLILVRHIHIYHQPQLWDTFRNHQPLKSNKPICFRLWSRPLAGQEQDRQTSSGGLTLPLKFWHSGVLHSRVGTKLPPPPCGCMAQEPVLAVPAMRLRMCHHHFAEWANGSSGHSHPLRKSEDVHHRLKLLN